MRCSAFPSFSFLLTKLCFWHLWGEGVGWCSPWFYHCFFEVVCAVVHFWGMKSAPEVPGPSCYLPSTQNWVIVQIGLSSLEAIDFGVVVGGLHTAELPSHRFCPNSMSSFQRGFGWFAKAEPFLLLHKGRHLLCKQSMQLCYTLSNLIHAKFC